MPLIEIPMGCNDYCEELAQFPMLGTPKKDGVRGYTKNGCVYSKSNKLIPNQHIQRLLPTLLSDGFDFELFVSGGFNATTSVVMGHSAAIDDLEIYVFDYVSPNHEIVSYLERCKYLNRLKQNWAEEKVHFLLPVVINNPEQLATYYNLCIAQGDEGIVLRKPSGGYKFGKSTVLEQLMLRVTGEATSEATIIGLNEEMENTNESFISETGRSKKSKAQAGLIPTGLLGSFTVRDLYSEVVFDLTASNGINKQQQRDYWNDRDNLMIRIVKYAYKSHGTVDKPRQPKFLGFRDSRDLSLPEET